MTKNKLRKILLVVGIIGLVLSIALLMIAPLLSEDMAFSGVEAFGKGLLALVSFDFNDAPTVLIGSLFWISVIAAIIWLISVIVHKGGAGNIVKSVIALVAMVGIFGVMGAFFVARIDFADKVTLLYDALVRMNGNALAKTLTLMSVGYAYLSLMCFTLFAFMNFTKLIKE